MKIKSLPFILLVTLMGLMLILPFNLSRARAASENSGFRVMRSTRSMTTPLANFTVTNLNDSGTGSLRQAISDANTTPGPDVINFSVTGTITLTTGQLPIIDALTINGPGPNSLTISGNNASRVFAVAFATVTISDLTISNARTGDFDFGGGISNGQGILTVSNCVLSGNYADEGGAIWNGGGTVTINNSTLSGNTAAFGVSGAGGAIYNIFGTAIINNSTLSNNSIAAGITGAGGGIYNTNGVVTIINSTISNNSANVGGGIHNDATTTVKNSIVANNPGGDCSGGEPINAMGVNFTTSISCPGFTLVPSTGTGGLNLGPLQDNGGPTQTHALLLGSVAIDAVTDCTDINGNPITTDQRGVSRPLDGDGDGVSRCDVGAFEAPGLFDLCIQDESNGSILKINSTTGDYQFTNCSGFTLSGKGSLIIKGSFLTLQHNAADRRVLAKLDTSMKKGTASIQVSGQGTIFMITDRNAANNTCACTVK